MTSFNSNLEAILYMLKTSKATPTYIEKNTGISRPQVHRWKNNNVKSVRDESVRSVADALGYNLTRDKNKLNINTPQENNSMHTQAYENQIEINQLLREKIGFLEEKLNNQPVRVTKKTIITTSLWDQVDYDVQTFQTYDKEDLGYFKTYKIIKWQEFFAKLGYVGQEARAAYEKHRNSVYLTNRNKDNSEYFHIQKEATDSRLYSRKVSRDFFKNEFAQQTVSKMTRFNINYLHKNGSFVPAILHSLFDFDNLTGVSKIKFIEQE